MRHLEEVVLAWIEKVTAGRPYIWQQDCIILNKQENPVLAVRKFLLPHYPNSSDHNPFDYYACGAVEWEIK